MVDLPHPEGGLASAVIYRVCGKGNRDVCAAAPQSCHPEHSLPRLLQQIAAPGLLLPPIPSSLLRDVNWQMQAAGDR